MERIIWGFGDGSTLPVFDTAIGKLGAVICWENYMPLLRMAMYAKGIELYCAPTADDRDTWQPTMQHVALEGRCFVLSACQYLRRADCPADDAAIQGDDPDTVIMRGGSVIVGPLGQVLAGPLFNQNGILVADIDLGEAGPVEVRPRRRRALRAPGHFPAARQYGAAAAGRGGLIDQNMNLAASCMTRGSSADVIVPKPAAPATAVGAPNCGVFNTLKISDAQLDAGAAAGRHPPHERKIDVAVRGPSDRIARSRRRA